MYNKLIIMTLNKANTMAQRANIVLMLCISTLSMAACNRDVKANTDEAEPIACEVNDTACIERAGGWAKDETIETAINASNSIEASANNPCAGIENCDVAEAAPKQTYPSCAISQPPCSTDKNEDKPNEPRQLRGHFNVKDNIFESTDPQYETDAFDKGKDYASVSRVNADGDILGLGLINKKGWMMVPPKYDSIGTGFSNVLFQVGLNNKQGLVDRTGKEIVPPYYDTIMTEKQYDGLYLVKLNEKYGLINTQGVEVIPVKYDSITTGMGEGLFAVYVNGAWGYINKQDKMIIPPTFSSPSPFINGKAVLQRENENYQEYTVYPNGRIVKKD